LKRCGKSCRLRWVNYLRPNIKHGRYSEEEENIICSLYISIGSRWSFIASHMSGRTDNDIKNYWNTTLKKKLLGNPKDNQEDRRRLLAAAAKHTEVNWLRRYVPPEANITTNACGTQLQGEEYHMKMNMNDPFVNLGPEIAPQLFEEIDCVEPSTIADTSPSSQSPRFQFNFQQTFVPDHDSSFKDPIERLQNTLIDPSNNMNIMSISQMNPSNFITSNKNHASQLIPAQDSYRSETVSPLVEYTTFMENHECPTVLPEIASPSISCGSVDENLHQLAWMSTVNAENDSNLDYEFLMDWNDVLSSTKNNCSSQMLDQMEANYGCGPFVDGQLI
ncbi:hypothetical protein KI387_028923, partial [Taxus chinensis]